MSKIITIRKLSTGTIFKLIAIGNLCSIILFSLLMGIFAFFGMETVYWNNKQLVGLEGLIASPLIGLFISLISTVFSGILVSFGLWVFSKFRTIEIDIKE
ncbi:MAG: hypothetical protein WC253_03930 [Sulfurovaceae bacterium]|nr:hypothetical protein [Sulfurovaceae bacterium]